MKSAHLFLVFVFSLAILGAPVFAEEEEPAYRNPNPHFKPLSKDVEQSLIKQKLGKPPALDPKKLADLKKGKVLVREIPSETKTKRYEAIGIVNHSPAMVMAFMKDYPAKLGIFPHLEQVTASWNENMATVHMVLKVAFKTIRYRLNFLHYGDYFIEFEYVEGDLKNTSGSYKFFPMSQGTKTLVVYNVSSDPGIPLPDFILNLLTKSSLPDVIEAIGKGAAMKQKEADLKQTAETAKTTNTAKSDTP